MSSVAKLRETPRSIRSSDDTDRPREEGGWRRGRPVEDPQKTKRWGFVAAKPSEFLVHVRRGKVRQRTSGQGATCFKWPWDAVSIVPTSLQRLRFVADQVTLEKVGVEVRGLAVYRIADPILAYRVLNFSYPERAQEKLEETLTSMFIGAVRRLIANLGVEDCLQKRKSALAKELIKEIAPVVGGEGRPDDPTHKGWGVVIDTIEIQEVRVMSEKVFSDMQAPYRAALELRAREAKAEAERQIAARETDCNRSIQEARIQAELEIQDKQAELESFEATKRRTQQLRAAEIEREIEAARVRTELAGREERRRLDLAETEAERERALRQADDDRTIELAQLQRRAEVRAQREQAARLEAEAATEAEVHHQQLRYREADAELAVHDRVAALHHQRRELGRVEWQAQLEERRERAELMLQEGRHTAAVELERAKAQQEAAAAQATVLMAQNMPALAAAMGEKIGEVRVMQIGGDQNPFASIAGAVGAVVEMARSPAFRGGTQ